MNDQHSLVKYYKIR